MLRHPEKLRGVHPNLVLLMEEVGKDREIVAVWGARSIEDEWIAIRTGHSKLTDPMRSKHVTDPEKRPLALAVDVAPFPIDWLDIEGFRALNEAVQTKASEMGLAIRWGGKWGDYDHWELTEG